MTRYQRAQAVPASGPRERSRELDCYLPYLRQRWEAGEHNVRILWDALRAQGFCGSYHCLGRYLTQWRTESVSTGPLTAQHPPTTLPPRQRAISARHLRRWCCADLSDLTKEQRTFLAEAYRRCPDLRTMQQHLTRFITIVRQRERAALDDWLHAAEETGLPDLVGFVQGIRRDFAAVARALEYSFSQGVVEGQINRLNCQAATVWPSKPACAQAACPALRCLTHRHMVDSRWKQQVFTEKSGEPGGRHDRADLVQLHTILEAYMRRANALRPEEEKHPDSPRKKTE